MKKREINRFIKPRKDENGRLLCLIPTCNKLRQKYKTTNNIRNYCEDHTFLDIQEFTNWSVLRKKVLERDNYVCVKCGDDRKEVEVKLIRRRCINIREMVDHKENKFRYEKAEYVENRNNLIADHIKPIALGGDEWNINNIQTLCLKCNKIKTSNDLKEIAKQRKCLKENRK